MRIALIVTGLISALVLAFPGLVIIGYFLLLIPGLILQSMPTVFLYLLAVWLIAMLIPVRNKWIARSIAFAIVLLVGSLIILPFRIGANADYEAAKLPDIAAGAPIELSGDVRLDQPTFLESGRLPSCDALCMAILDLDTVTSVTVRDGFEAATFRLVRRDEEEGEQSEEAETPERIAPYSPGQIILLTESVGSQAAVDAYWEQRLASDNALSREPALNRADFTLSEIIEGDPRGLWVTRVEIRRGDENLLRESYIKARIPALPPFVGFDAGGADSGFSGSGFTLGAIQRESGDPLFPGSQQRKLAQALALKDYSMLTDPDQPGPINPDN